MAEMLERWAAYVDQVRLSDKVAVVEASYFNNLIETLLAHNVDRPKIIQYADALQALIEPLNPTLVYLVQEDVEKALERNFKGRGQGFMNYVIRYATETPFARWRDLEGYDGMLKFWQAFVDLTDELFQRCRLRKLRIDNAAGNWVDYSRQVLGCLSIPLLFRVCREIKNADYRR